MRWLCVGMMVCLHLPVPAKAGCAGELAVLVSKSNPTNDLSLAQLRKVLLGQVTAWPDHKLVSLVTRDAQSDVFQCALTQVVRMGGEEYLQYLASAELRGTTPVSLRLVDSSERAMKVIAESPGAIALVEASSVAAKHDAVKVIRINGKHPGQAGYPL